LINGKQKQINQSLQILSDTEDGSDEDSDEKKNKNFFESMIYWQLEENRKKGTKKLQQSAE
jgi:hypothetical protein